ncbi:hypothetical protein D3C71_827510 [compost metagenome]
MPISVKQIIPNEGSCSNPLVRATIKQQIAMLSEVLKKNDDRTKKAVMIAIIPTPSPR